MCMDKPKTAEFLKNAASEIKSVLMASSDLNVVIETFQKENVILKEELDRINKENADLRAYIESIPMFKKEDSLEPLAKPGQESITRP